MASKKNKAKNDPASIRKRGTRDAVGEKERRITFSLSKQIKGEGQTIDEWNELGLHAKLLNRIKFVGQHSVHIVRQNQFIKEYHKVEFPPNSGFSEPKHITEEVTWAVMHITTNSKEVVVGYIDEDDVFQIIFLDKDHQFWPVKKR